MKNKYSIFSIIKNSLSYHENWQRAWRDPEPKKSYDAVQAYDIEAKQMWIDLIKNVN